MDSFNEYFPPQKRLKPMVEAEPALACWDTVNANDLNAELPDELRDISNSNISRVEIPMSYFQTDPGYQDTQHSHVDHRQIISFSTEGQHLSNDSGVQVLFSGDFKTSEMSGQSQFPDGSKSLLLKFEDKSVNNIISAQTQKDSNYATSIIPQQMELNMQPLKFQVQQALQIFKTSSSLQIIPECKPSQNTSTLSQISSISQTSTSEKTPQSRQPNVQLDPSLNTLTQNRCLIQKQLILLLHANKCQKGKNSSRGSVDSNCNIPQCQTMKDVLSHLAGCKEDNNCQVPYCASSRQIIQHWKKCSNSQCAVCQPLRLACEKKNASLLSKSSQGVPLQSSSAAPHHPSSLKPPRKSHFQSSHMEFTTDLKSDLAHQDVERNVNVDIKCKGFSSPKPKMDWHQGFGKEFRDTVVYKLMKCLYPACGNLKLNELTSIIFNMKNLEKAAYENATSKVEYYNMLSMKLQMMKTGSDIHNGDTMVLPQKKTSFSSVPQITDTFYSTTNAMTPLNHQETNGVLREMSQNTIRNLNINPSNTLDISSLKMMGPLKEKFGEMNPGTGVTSSIRETTNAGKEVVESLVGSSSDVSVSTSSTKVWRKDELKSLLLPILSELIRIEPESLPFRQPVNPVLEGVPEYFEVIKKPMDLSTVRKKLEEGTYDEPWGFVDDMWQMFENAWTFNKKGSRVHKYCTKLSEIFDPLMNVLMRKLGYCCGHKHMFTPIVLVCYGKFMCTIPINCVYYMYQNRFSYCEKCFDSFPGDYIELSEEPGHSITRLTKSHFVKMKNGEFEYEKLVECPTCGRKQHAVCCLHLEQFGSSALRCPSCPKDENLGRTIEKKFCAKKLPQTHLSSYLETRVNSFLRRSDAASQGVVIRVLSSSEKYLEVKQGMKKVYTRENKNVMQFPYMSKAIFAFMEDKEVEVCFFGMHVHEYDSKCPQPNSRRVYIAYMDSVNFFHPRHLRTSVYHELLIGYLDYVKKIGFAHAHIWVCPPSEGDDYIFNCHPPNMRIPKQRRLQDWYRKLLDKALSENIIYDYKDLLKDIKERRVTSITEIPYFDGDYWPSILEEFLKEVADGEAQNCKHEDIDDNDCFEVEVEGTNKERKDFDAKKKRLRSRAIKRQPRRGIGECDVMARVLLTLEKLKEGFFVVNLHSPEAERSLGEIKDPDQCILNDLMDGRDSFLALAREKHFEFSSLRRAKHSTLALLYELHAQGRVAFTYSCNSCKAIIDSHYHCSVCPDFDLCGKCYSSEGHIHAMEKSKEVDRKREEMTASSELSSSRYAVLMKDMALLIHVFRCHSGTCHTEGCHKMKLVIQHVKLCSRKNDKTCSTCRHFLALSCCHAKRCNNPSCSVPLCDAIKQKFLLQKRLQNKMLKRRMASLRRDVGLPVEGETQRPLLNSEPRRNQLPVIKVAADNVETQKFSEEDEGSRSTKNSAAREVVCASSTLEHSGIVVNLNDKPSPRVMSNSLSQSKSAQSVLLLVNPNLGAVHGNAQVIPPGDPQPVVLQLQSNHCLLTNVQGEVLGLVQMPIIQNQHIVNIPQTPQIISPSVSSSQMMTSMAIINKSQPLNIAATTPSYLHLKAPCDQSFQSGQVVHQVQSGISSLTQPVVNRVMDAGGSTASVSKSSTSALQTLYKTLKSSPLPQHQQLLNILMSDPLKLAKVIKQKHINKGVSLGKPAQQVFSAAPSVSMLSQLVATGTTTVSRNSQVFLEEKVQPHNNSNFSSHLLRNNFIDLPQYNQHSLSVTTNPAEAVPIFNSLQNESFNFFNGEKDGTKQFVNFGNEQLNLNPTLVTEVQSSTIIPSSSVCCLSMNDDSQHQQLILHSIGNQTFEKFLDSQSNTHLNMVEGVVKQQSFAEVFSHNTQESQRSISVSSDMLGKVLTVNESNSHLTNTIITNPVNGHLNIKLSKISSGVHSALLASQSITGHQLNKASFKNVMLSNQLPCVLEIPNDSPSTMKHSEFNQPDGSLQDQLSRFAEEL